MNRADNSALFSDLRLTYPVFTYEDYTAYEKKGNLIIEFSYNLSNTYYFTPSLIIPRKSWMTPDIFLHPLFRAIAFNIGMIELLSYWKATCSPRIVVHPHSLDQQQVAWWRNIYYHGLGEFFYRNSIDADPEGLLTIVSSGDNSLIPGRVSLSDGYVIPVGGGKDSCVTLNVLSGLPAKPFILNPGRAAVDIAARFGYPSDDIIEFHREIHPRLLELNTKGFLNGHTPFSALLAFHSLLASLLAGFRHLTFSNEASANEPTIPHTHINHQYSKTFQFEKDFREYYTRYIAPDFNYFSLLRPLNELQIARLFSRHERCHDVFRSCNQGSKSDSWCGRCAKCLFTFIILSPFMAEKELVKIFGHNLLEDLQLKEIFDQLTGHSDEKPFECVGTIREVNAAVRMLIRSRPTESLPSLLRYYASTHDHAGGDDDDERLLHVFNSANFVPAELQHRIKQAIHG